MAFNPIPPNKKEFRYTPEEAQRIADTLPDFPYDIDEDRYLASESGRMILESITSDKSEKIARTLEEYFRSVLEENIMLGSGVELPTESQDQAALERITKLARNLQVELEKPNSMRLNYAALILGSEKFAVRRETGLPVATDKIALRVLDLIEHNRDQALQKIETWHREDRYKVNQHNRSRAMFVADLCDYWEWWVGEPPAKSRSGGRAAKFVFAAINPVLVFMKEACGQQWHPSVPLTEESQAADLIFSHLKNPPRI